MRCPDAPVRQERGRGREVGVPERVRAGARVCQEGHTLDSRTQATRAHTHMLIVIKGHEHILDEVIHAQEGRHARNEPRTKAV